MRGAGGRLRAMDRNVEHATAPELERQKRPQLEIEVSSTLVQLDQPLDMLGVEETTFTAGVGKEHVAREAGQLPSEPAGQRHGETFASADR